MANPITPSAANYAHEKMRVMTESGELYNIAELLEGLTASVSQVKDAVYYAPYTPTPTLGALTVELQAGVECLPTAAVDTLTLNFGATSAANPYWYIKFFVRRRGLYSVRSRDGGVCRRHTAVRGGKTLRARRRAQWRRLRR